MAYTQADLNMVDRHIAQAEAHIVGQERVITRLRQAGATTLLAEELLREFQDLLQQHCKHRNLIVDDLRSHGML